MAENDGHALTPDQPAWTGVGPGGVFVLFYFWLLFTILMPGFPQTETPDFHLLHLLTEEGKLGSPEPPGYLFFPAPDGNYYDAHEIGATVAVVPATVVARGIALCLPSRLREHAVWFLVSLVGPFYAAVACLYAWKILREFYQVASGTALLAITVLACATQFVVYAVSPSDINLITMLATVSWYYTLRFRARRQIGDFFLAACASSLMVVVKITSVPLALALQLCPFIAARERVIGRLALAGALWLPAVVWTGYYNLLRTGNPLKFPYTDINTFSPDLLPGGLIRTLFDPSRGLFLFNPLLILLMWYTVRACRSSLKWEIGLLIAAFVATLVRISGTEYWHGGTSWGARYYSPFLFLFGVVAAPLLLATTSVLARTGAALLAALGVTINLSGLLSNWHYRFSFLGHEAQITGVSPLWPPVDAVCALGRNLWRSVGGSVPLDVVQGASEFNIKASNSLSVWWLNLRFVGVPVGVCLLLGGGMIAATVYFGVCAARARRTASASAGRRLEDARQPALTLAGGQGAFASVAPAQPDAGTVPQPGVN
jgi:hypothetical protein